MRLSLLLASGATLVAAKENPIRRVVNLLQEMASEIETEIEKEKKSYEKFQCYCKKNDGDLDGKTKEAAALIKKTNAEVEGLTGQKKALAEEIARHKKERKQAEKDLEAAINKRTEEKTKYDEDTKDVKKTLEDIDVAISALEKGMGKSFLQTGAASYLKNVVEQNQDTIMSNLDVNEQETVLAFLEEKKDYAPQSGEIVGILKMMKQNFDDSLGGIIGAEEKAVASFLKLKGTLEDLIKTSTASIEKKQELKGTTSVKIVEGKNLVATTEKQMGDDMKTIAQLKEACSGKNDEFKVRQEDAANEVAAINEAIGVLNNDDALDLFNKTDTREEAPASGEAFIQVSAEKQGPAQALAALSKAAKSSNPAIAMLAYAAKAAMKNGAKKVDFSKVMKMIDDMVVLLKNEAADDVAVREQCNESFNSAAMEKKETSHAIKGLNASIEDLASTIEAQAAIVKKSVDEVASSKKAISEATEQRKTDNADFVAAVDLNKQAVALIEKAKQKLNAYYNPQLVTTTLGPAVSKEDQILAGASTVFIQQHSQDEDLPEGAPETWAAGERQNKGKKGSSVIALLDLLMKDLNKDTTTLEQDEALAQQEYEKLSADLKENIVASTKAMNDASKSKADAEADKQTAESTLSMKEDEMANLNQTVADLHAKCDFLLANFEDRKAKRENEVAGLQKAKAILAGADYE